MDNDFDPFAYIINTQLIHKKIFIASQPVQSIIVWKSSHSECRVCFSANNFSKIFLIFMEAKQQFQFFVIEVLFLYIFIFVNFQYLREIVLTIRKIISAYYKMSILQDKVQHNLIKINKLMAQGEELRYIVPLFYNAIKDIYENCSFLKFQSSLLEQLIYKFRLFHEEYQLELSILDQVHSYMIQECFEMLGSRQILSKSDLKKSQLFSKNVSKAEKYNAQQEVVILTPQTYYFQSQSEQEIQIVINQPRPGLNSRLMRPISLDDVPQSLQSGQDTNLLWNTLEQLYEQHRIDEAVQQCQKFQNSLFLSDPNSKIKHEKYDLIEKIHQEQEMMTQYYQYFNQPGYTFDKEENGVKMYYKIQEKTKEVAVRIEAQLDISIQRFLCISTQIDLLQEFVPFAYDTKQLARIGRNKKLGLTRVYIPILSNRQAYFYAAAYDRLSTCGSIFCFSKTITSDREFQQKLNVRYQKDPELVQLEYKFYIFEYIPITLKRGKIRLATNIDMKITFLPLFIINKTIRIFSFDLFKNLMEVNAKFEGSTWQKKMKQRPELYVFFRQRIKRFLEEQDNLAI